jgi:cytochrome c-type biogenesis protein CcmH/NrfG
MTGVASVEGAGATEVAVSDGAIENDAPVQEVARVAPEKSKPESADCLSAESEFQQASAKSETPDKLFHLRRALRLCPDEPRFHSSLGDVYKILGRQSDAQFEYQEALKLSPGNPDVKEKLGALGADAKEQY